MSRIVYLHGFASSPASKKARFFRERFAQLGIGLEIPDLAEGNFERLTITGQLRVILRAVRKEPVTLMGSSMGGYLAALFAARHLDEVEKLVLLAPAFCFQKRWLETRGSAELGRWRSSGSLEVFHYGEGRAVPLGYQLIDDAIQYEDYPNCPQPTLIFHGINDTVVPSDYSVAFAATHPNATLRLFSSGHELVDVLDQMWMETERFCLGTPAAG
jgi:pimeloyl-ACP methyl ester carboxylesterase